MATAAIPVALTLANEALPILVPIIKSLIGHLGTHVQNPTVVQQTVSDSVTPIVNTLATSGILPSTVDPALLNGVIQTLIHEMGTANPPAPAPKVPVTTDGGDILVPAGPPESPSVITTPSVTSLPPGTKFNFTGTLTLES